MALELTTEMRKPTLEAEMGVQRYRPNKSSGKLEVVMLVDKWREYINNARYKISSPANAEVETKKIDIVSLLSGKSRISNSATSTMYSALARDSLTSTQNQSVASKYGCPKSLAGGRSNTTSDAA